MSSLPDQPIPTTSFSGEFHRHGRSKAQMCLFKILHVISFFPAVDISEKQHDVESRENIGFDVDLNIGLRAPAEIESFEPPATPNAGADRKNRVFSKNDLSKSDEKAEQSEISHVGDQSSGIDCDGVSGEIEEEKLRDEGYLGLLIEAAQLILGDGSEPPAGSKYVESSSPATATAEKGEETKRKRQCWTAATEAEWYGEFEDSSPVVKSKRGRSQVLPFKYRDSVVEPLVRWPASSRYRSNLNVVVPSKRRAK